jgi:pimeloyl-ACP methyl ester carboxylesterase
MRQTVNDSTMENPKTKTAPVEDLSVPLDGAKVRFLQAGSGPSLLLVHGLLGYSFSWRYTIPALAGQATVFAPDLPGAGFSPGLPLMDCCLPACAARLLRFMDAAGIDECDIMGTSHGGAVAMQAAAMSPQRVRRLILVAPTNPWSAHGRILAGFLSSSGVAPALVKLAPRLRILQEFYFRRLFADPRRIRPGTLPGYMEPVLEPGALEYAVAKLRSWNRDLRDLASVLPRISRIPTLLIWGSRDAAVDPASAAQLRNHFRDCRLLMMEGIGHLPYEEAPDEFNRAVAEFLAHPIND